MRRQNLDLASPKSYADRLFCQKLPLNPRLRLSPLSAPVDGAQNLRLFTAALFAGKTQISVGVFSSLGGDDQMVGDAD